MELLLTGAVLSDSIKSSGERNVMSSSMQKSLHELNATLLDDLYLIFLQSPSSRRVTSIVSFKLLLIIDTLLSPGSLIMQR